MTEDDIDTRCAREALEGQFDYDFKGQRQSITIPIVLAEVLKNAGQSTHDGICSQTEFVYLQGIKIGRAELITGKGANKLPMTFHEWMHGMAKEIAYAAVDEQSQVTRRQVQLSGD
jgi:hypothetical protein